MKNFIFLINLLKCLLSKATLFDEEPYPISIGLVYCDENHLKNAISYSDKLNKKSSRILIDIKGLQLNQNYTPLSVSLSVCDDLMAAYRVYGIILTDSSCLFNPNDTNHYLSVYSAISFTSAYYNLPVLDLTSRNAEFSDKVYFI